jgi:hypothetical protein
MFLASQNCGGAAPTDSGTEECTSRSMTKHSGEWNPQNGGSFTMRFYSAGDVTMKEERRPLVRRTDNQRRQILLLAMAKAQSRPPLLDLYDSYGIIEVKRFYRITPDGRDVGDMNIRSDGGRSKSSVRDLHVDSILNLLTVRLDSESCPLVTRPMIPAT